MIIKNWFGIVFNKPDFRLVIPLLILIGLNLFESTLSNFLNQNIKGLTFIFLLLITFSSGILELLKNVYVFFIWFLLSLIWFYKNLEVNFYTAIIPLSLLFYSQMIRIIFRIIFNKIPIHLTINKFTKNKYSELEKRFSDKKDFYYSVLYSILGIGIFLIFAFLST